jgi:hypothetical protein
MSVLLAVVSQIRWRLQLIGSDDLSFDGVSEDLMKIRLGLQAEGKNPRRQHAFIGISG